MMNHRRLSKRPAFLGLAVNLLKTLSDDQVQELARNMARDQRELEDEMLAGTEQETARARAERTTVRDRKSTRLNSSHVRISYAVFCLKKKKKKKKTK